MENDLSRAATAAVIQAKIDNSEIRDVLTQMGYVLHSTNLREGLLMMYNKFNPHLLAYMYFWKAYIILKITTLARFIVNLAALWLTDER